MNNRLIKVLLISILVILLAVPMVSGKEFIGIATGSTGGTFYPAGVAIATVLDNQLSESTGVQFSAHTSGGSAENLEMLKNQEIKMAIAGSVPASQAYRGVGNYEGNEITNIRYITALYPEVVQLVYRADSGIKTISDFAGKKIAVGPPGGGGSFYCPTIFEVVGGITFDDFNNQYLGYSNSVQALQNNLIDACYLGASYPTSAVSQVYASPTEVGMVEFTDEDLAKLREVAPYYARIVISAGTYPGQDEDLNLVGFKSSLIAEKSIDEDLVYKMLEVIYLEKLDELKQRQAALEVMTVGEAINGLSGAPLHAGAVRFYRDQGIDVPDELVPPEMM
ncbi:MAG TPA: TAXI family TRAP transporter solute-binding subunit [Halanaerobiales bacterium]|nr:TAXI family TRAP transporter solute-binding subunit [Halanaerobiales bacterium]